MGALWPSCFVNLHVEACEASGKCRTQSCPKETSAYVRLLIHNQQMPWDCKRKLPRLGAGSASRVCDASRMQEQEDKSDSRSLASTSGATKPGGWHFGEP